MTPLAVSALGDALAVPQTGPLPGAYAQSMLPELESRLGRGELSLRGVNQTVLELDERLLADVDTPGDLELLDRPGHALVVGGTGMLAGLTRSSPSAATRSQWLRVTVSTSAAASPSPRSTIATPLRWRGSSMTPWPSAAPSTLPWRGSTRTPPMRRAGGEPRRTRRPAVPGLRDRVAPRRRAAARRLPAGSARVARHSLVDPRGDLGGHPRRGRGRPSLQHGRRTGDVSSRIAATRGA